MERSVILRPPIRHLKSYYHIFQIFALNISAPFIAQFFKSQLDEVLPHTDILFGNESEAEVYAEAAGYPDKKDIPDIARRIAHSPKTNTSPRVVIFTQGADSTIVVSSDKPEAQKFPVEKLTDDQIVDTNGAGDAFAGGVLAALIAGKTLSEAVLVGHALSRASILQVCGPFRVHFMLP